MSFPIDCDCPESLPIAVTSPPGAPGAAGTNGADGADGLNCFSVTTASFVIPAVDATVAVTVENTDWIAVGQLLFVEEAGTFEVDSVSSATVVVLKNLDGYDNVAVATSVVSGAKVTPTGPKGEAGEGLDGTLAISQGGTGQTTKTAAFDALAPTTTKGDVIVHDGTDNVRVPVGADDLPLCADSAEASGVKYKAIDLAGDGLTGTLPADRGGMGDVSDIPDSSVLVFHPAADLTGVKYEFGAIRAPGATDDSGDDFIVGSRWILLADPLADPPVDGTEYVCVDATPGAAVWRPTTLVAGGAAYTRTAVSGSTHTILRTENFIAVTSNTCTLTLPAGATWPNNLLFIKHEGSGTPAIVIDGNSSETIEGAATYTITSKGGCVILYWAGNTNQWRRADKRPEPVDLLEGGTNQGTWTAQTLVRVSADGTKLETVPANAAIANVTLPAGITNGEISGLTIGSSYSQSEVQALRNATEALRDSVDELAGKFNTLLGYLRASGGTKFIS